VERFYEHEQLKNRPCLWRPIKSGNKLQVVFRALKIKRPQFDVKDCIPADIEVFSKLFGPEDGDYDIIVA